MRVVIALLHGSCGFIYSTLSRICRAGSETELVASSKYLVRDLCDAQRKADTPVLLLNGVEKTWASYMYFKQKGGIGSSSAGTSRHSSVRENLENKLRRE